MQEQRSGRSWYPFLLGAGALAIAHCAALLFRIQPAVSLWFPPSGVAIALAIWFGPIAALVTAVVSIIVAPLWGNQGWTQWAGLTDGIEPLLAWWLYRQVWQRPSSLDCLKDVGAFILSGPGIACAGSAILGSSVLALVGNMPWEILPQSILHWWLGNAIGTMAIAPLAILSLTPVFQKWKWLPELTTPHTPTLGYLNPARLRTEKIAIFSMSLVIALLTVSQTSRTGFTFQQFAFLNFIPIFWAALRFGAVGGIGAASFCVIAALLSYVLKYPYVVDLQNFPIDPGVLTVHKLSLLTQCIVGLIVGTAITRQTQAQVELAISQVQLAEYEVKSRLNEKLETTNRTLSETNAQLQQANREKDELLMREQAARSQAEAANRVKDEFLAVVSHELRSPLNPILGWSQLLRSGKLSPETTERALETIDRNAKLQAQLIEDLLDVSRILRGKLVLHETELDIELVIRSAIETVRLSAEAKAIALTFTPPSATKILIYGDANRLQQIIVNLLTNAIKFTPKNGKVNIDLECVNETADHDSRVDYAEIRVGDTGKGIHPDFLPHVFERFQQEDTGTTRKFGGLGLGLAIVRHLVDLHHGKVEAYSEGVDCGATFIVQLPAIAVSSDSSSDSFTQATPAAKAMPSLKGKQILVLEDDADTRTLLQYALEAEQATVMLMASAQDAITQFTMAAPHLIISDISMPDMDGYSFIRYIRSVQSHHIPAIALTANVREEDQHRAIAAGFDIHLAKPIIPETLLSEMERLISAC